MDSKDRGRVLSAIKRSFSRSMTAIAARNAAKCPRKKGPRGGARYRCKLCGKDYGVTDMNVDHIEPVVPIGTATKDMSWDDIVNRTYCDIENLQFICEKCHKLKSKAEAKARKEDRESKREG